MSTPESSLEEPLEIDRLTTIAAISLLSTLSALFINLLPIFLGAAAADFDWSESEVGFFASSGMLGMLFGTLTAPFWVRRWAWRRVSRIGVIGGGGLYCALPWIDSLYGILGCMFLIGGVLSALVSICVAAISDTTRTQRNFGIVISTQVIFSSAAGVLMDLCVASAGFTGAATMLGTFLLAGGLLVPWLPDRGRGQATSPSDPAPASRAGSSNLPVFLALAGSLVFYFALSAMWAFLGLLAEQAGIDTDVVARAIAASLLVGGIGSLMGAIFGERIGKLVPIALGGLTVGLAFTALRLGISPLGFFILAALFNVGWNFSLVYQMGAVAAVDQTGRHTVLVTAFQATGGALGPAAGGMILEIAGFWTLVGFEFAVLLISFLLFVLSQRTRSQSNSIIDLNRPGETGQGT